MTLAISWKEAAETTASDAVFFKAEVVNLSEDSNVYFACVTCPLGVAYITGQAAEEEQQQLELEKGAQMKPALQMQDLHALEHESVGAVETILRSAWARCETIRDNTWFAHFAKFRPNPQSWITHLTLSLRNNRAADAEDLFTALCGCEP